MKEGRGGNWATWLAFVVGCGIQRFRQAGSLNALFGAVSGEVEYVKPSLLAVVYLFQERQRWCRLREVCAFSEGAKRVRLYACFRGSCGPAVWMVAVYS